MRDLDLSGHIYSFEKLLNLSTGIQCSLFLSQIMQLLCALAIFLVHLLSITHLTAALPSLIGPPGFDENTRSLNNTLDRASGRGFDAIVQARLHSLLGTYHDLSFISIDGFTNSPGSYDSWSFERMNMVFYVPSSGETYQTSNEGTPSPSTWSTPQAIARPVQWWSWRWDERDLTMGWALQTLRSAGVSARWDIVTISVQNIPGMLPQDIYYSWIAPNWQPPAIIFLGVSSRRIITRKIGVPGKLSNLLAMGGNSVNISQLITAI